MNSVQGLGDGAKQSTFPQLVSLRLLTVLLGLLRSAPIRERKRCKEGNTSCLGKGANASRKHPHVYHPRQGPKVA